MGIGIGMGVGMGKKGGGAGKEEEIVCGKCLGNMIRYFRYIRLVSNLFYAISSLVPISKKPI